MMKKNKKHKRKISIYTRSGEISPSSYYRILQYTKCMDDFDIKVRALLSDTQFEKFHNYKKNNTVAKLAIEFFYYCIMLLRIGFSLFSDIIRKPHILIVSRSFVPRYEPLFIRFFVNRILLNAKLIWDFDDHILENKQISKSTFCFLSEKSHYIIVIHDFLKALIPSQFRDKVILLPTTDGDMRLLYNDEAIIKLRETNFHNKVVLVWVATSGNLPYLENIVPALDETSLKIAKVYNKELVLNVVCNMPLLVDTKSLIVNNIKWTRESAIEAMSKAHIGIMPLTDSDFARGKGGFKLVQYLSVGLPVIGSNVGYNKEIVNSDCGFLVNDKLSQNEWITGVFEIVKNWETYLQFSQGAFNRWNENFSFDNNYSIWQKIL